MFPYHPKLYNVLVAMRAPQIAGLSCQGGSTSVCEMTLCCGMCLANILNLDMFVFAVEEVAQFSVHIPVTYKNCTLLYFEGYNIMLCCHQ